MRSKSRFIFAPFLFILFTSHGASAQYSRPVILAAADSITRQILGLRIFPFATAEKDLSYNYIDEGGNEQTATFVEGDTFTVNNTTKVFIDYEVHYTYPKCDAGVTVEGSFTLTLDGKLNLLGQPDLSFIPAYIKKGDSCDLISKARALAIAVSNGFKGTSAWGQPETSLQYISGSSSYKWSIIGARPKQPGQDDQFETIEIDAQTGQVLMHVLNGESVAEK